MRCSIRPNGLCGTKWHVDCLQRHTHPKENKNKNKRKSKTKVKTKKERKKGFKLNIH